MVVAVFEDGKVEAFFVPDDAPALFLFKQLMKSAYQGNGRDQRVIVSAVGDASPHVSVPMYVYVYLLMCVSSFSRLRETYVYNSIISPFSGASLGAAPARRHFIRMNFWI